ncbi:MAG: phosphoglycerate kinase [Bauldia sp.]|uniref:phosphoglycerate kinase n=1 Tax=Bauldia sp. TaxID=2575872 RepID=UPI001D23FCFC|nr:phosphoglycerate kinase [Bauldia sp.]MCB1496128.1 phosphoglycerate kinase [Bauldia sp.]
MTAFRTLDDADLSGKRVLVRVDLNVPMADGKVSDDTRIRAVAPTITEVADNGGKVILLAHFGRPKGKPNPDMSLGVVVPVLSSVIGRPVAFATDCVGPDAAEAVAKMQDGDVLLLENTRFHAGEEKNEPDFVSALAGLGDVYVSDAFSASHRAHASTEGLAHKLPAYAGRAMQKEIEALESALADPERPVVAVIGGAKVSSKIDVLENLTAKVDALVIGGGMANTFLLAKGIAVGKSLCEPDLVDTATKIMAAADRTGCAIVLPVDVVVATEFKEHAANRIVEADAVPADGMILDIGPRSIAAVNAWIDKARTLVWNGPLGAFEIAPFDIATVAVARHAAERTHSAGLNSVAGGGETVAALHKAGVADDFASVSTAGGAFLEWLEGKALPGVEVLRRNA